MPPDEQAPPERSEVVLARVDQRTKYLEEQMTRLLNKFDNGHFVTRKEFDELRDGMADKVSNSEFTPVKLVVYGLIGLVLAGFATAVVALVIRGSGGKSAKADDLAPHAALAAAQPDLAGGAW